MNRSIKVTSTHILQKSEKKAVSNNNHDLPYRFRLCSGKGKQYLLASYTLTTLFFNNLKKPPKKRIVQLNLLGVKENELYFCDIAFEFAICICNNLWRVSY